MTVPAAATRRRVLSLPAEGCHLEVAAGLHHGLDAALRPYVTVRLGGPARLLDPWSPVAGRAALAISTWHAASGSSGDLGDDPGLVYGGCQRALRPGGVLAVVTASTIASGWLPDDPGATVTRARAAGLVYTQHIVAVHAVLRDSQITPAAQTAALRAAGAGAAHRRIHADILVFTKLGGTR